MSQREEMFTRAKELEKKYDWIKAEPIPITVKELGIKGWIKGER